MKESRKLQAIVFGAVVLVSSCKARDDGAESTRTRQVSSAVEREIEDAPPPRPTSSEPAAAAQPDDPSSRESMMKLLAGLKPGEERDVGNGTQFKLLRLQATEPIGGGWQRAASREGGFSVEIPLPFNELRIRAKSSDKVEMRTFTVGGKTGGLLAWSASCIARNDGQFLHAPPPDAIEPKGTPVRAWQRSLTASGRMCFAIVEAQGTDPLPTEGDRNRFLRSLRITGPVQW